MQKTDYLYILYNFMHHDRKIIKEMKLNIQTYGGAIKFVRFHKFSKHLDQHVKIMKKKRIITYIYQLILCFNLKL